jgi:hypothetical protein
LGCWISPRYGPFSLGVRFETYEPRISLIFLFFWPRQTADNESVDTGARLYKTQYHQRMNHLELYLRSNSMTVHTAVPNNSMTVHTAARNVAKDTLHVVMKIIIIK